MNDTPEVMTAEQAGAYLGLSAEAVKRRMSRQTIPYVKVGRYRRLRKSDLDQWLDRNAKGVHA